MKKFYDNIGITETGCWLWLAARNDHYGFIVIEGKTWLAHRFSYTLHCDEIPEGVQVLHHCDNGFCCNPKHLFLGTQQDNMTDKVLKDRQAKGSDNGNSKLTAEVVLEIRRLCAEQQLTQKAIAEKFNVDPTTITNIKLRRQWRHI
jgi:predicted XRE-type DNA-binding protein